MTPDGADLDEIASRSGLSADAFLEVFVQLDFTVGFLGFSPGFATTSTDCRSVSFHLPRRGTPRAAVPAGSVALAGPYAGNCILTLGPGRIGRRRAGSSTFAPIRLFSSRRANRVRFRL